MEEPGRDWGGLGLVTEGRTMGMRWLFSGWTDGWCLWGWTTLMGIDAELWKRRCERLLRMRSPFSCSGGSGLWETRGRIARGSPARLNDFISFGGGNYGGRSGQLRKVTSGTTQIYAGKRNPLSPLTSCASQGTLRASGLWRILYLYLMAAQIHRRRRMLKPFPLLSSCARET
jgi:hypothetical protein